MNAQALNDAAVNVTRTRANLARAISQAFPVDTEAYLCKNLSDAIETFARAVAQHAVIDMVKVTITPRLVVNRDAPVDHNGRRL